MHRAFSSLSTIPIYISCQVVSAIALETLSKCGAEYEREHQDDIIERRQFGVDGDIRANHNKPLPRPFAGRPRIGARLYVRRNTRRFLQVRMCSSVLLSKVSTQHTSVAYEASVADNPASGCLSVVRTNAFVKYGHTRWICHLLLRVL